MVNKKDALCFLKTIGLDNIESLAVIDYFTPDDLENLIKNNFVKSDSEMSDWIPVYVFNKFIRGVKPNYLFTASELGRRLSEIGVSSKNRHSKILGKTCAGYNLKAESNVLHYQLTKFKNDENNY